MANYLNEPGDTPDWSAKRFAVAVSTYNASVTDKLLAAALETLASRNIPSSRVDVVRVPGAWELALATRTLARTGRYDGIVSLGAVIRGETTHDRHINRFVSQALGQIALETGVPVGFGLLTCNNFGQARERSGGAEGNKGAEATTAMLEMVRLLELLPRSG